MTTSRFEEAAKPFIPNTPPAAGFPVAHFRDYSKRLSSALMGFDWAPVEQLSHDLLDC